jgi:hypothetical protein
MNPPDVSSLPRLPTDAELVTAVETALGRSLSDLIVCRNRKGATIVARYCLLCALVYVRGMSRNEASGFLNAGGIMPAHTAIRKFLQAEESDPLGRAWGKVWREIVRVVGRS